MLCSSQPASFTTACACLLCPQSASLCILSLFLPESKQQKHQTKDTCTTKRRLFLLPERMIQFSPALEAMAKVLKKRDTSSIQRKGSVDVEQPLWSHSGTTIRCLRNCGITHASAQTTRRPFDHLYVEKVDEEHAEQAAWILGIRCRNQFGWLCSEGGMGTNEEMLKQNIWHEDWSLNAPFSSQAVVFYRV